MTRTVPSPWSRTIPLAFSLVAGLAVVLLARPASAQEAAKGKDDALDNLLKEIKAEKAAPEKPSSEDKPVAKKKGDADAAKLAETAKPAPKADGVKKPAEVAPKDKDLDNLLEKLGTSEDRPSPDERRQGGAGMPPPDDKDEKPKSGAGEKPPAPKPDELTGKSKDLDEHLEELTGKARKKKKPQDGGGPMSELVKQMRDVEKRLNEPDTGAETRKQQQQIVKKLDSLIEQMRAQSGQPKGKQRQITMKPGGQQPGQDQGQDPGTNAGGAPNTKPAKPETRHSLAGGKDEWGHLPDALRQEMDNVFKEDFLTSRADLIERYYNALTKKKVKRGE